MPTRSALFRPLQRLGHIGTALLLLGLSLPSRAQTHPPPPPLPRSDWSVQASLWGGAAPDTYELEVSRDPRAAFTVRVRRSEITADVLNEQGAVVQRRTPITWLSGPPTDPWGGSLVIYAPRIPAHRLPGQTRMSLRWRPVGLKPGLYVLKLSVPIDATDAAGQPVVLPQPTDSARIYVPPAPDRLPSLVPGQRFLCLPGEGERLPYRDARGRPVPHARLALKMLTLKRVTRTSPRPALCFRLEGGGTVYLDGPIPTASLLASPLPGLKPVVEDATVRRLRAKYEGRRVWGYGGIGGMGITADPDVTDQFSSGVSQSYRIAHLVRVAGQPVALAIGAYSDSFHSFDRESTFVTSYPVIAILRPSHPVYIDGVSKNVSRKNREAQIRRGVDPLLAASVHLPCLGLYGWLSDAWDFDRTVSLVSPRRAGAHWPPAMLHAVLSRTLRVGMTPDMAAWTEGYPILPGTAAQVKAQPVWEYEINPPYHYWVRFQNGKVKTFGADGEAPMY